MKNLLFILILVVTGCGRDMSSESIIDEPKLEVNIFRVRSDMGFYQLHEFKYKEHEYLFISGTSLIHSESCPCKNK